jgi:phage protein D
VPSTTQGLILSVLDYRGQSKGDRIDVLSFGRYTNETNAEELAKRWFKLREKLGRWVDVTVDGHADLVPYTSIELDGDGLAPQDRGVWLPIVVNHTLNQSGWTCELRCVRVVEEAVVTPV